MRRIRRPGKLQAAVSQPVAVPSTAPRIPLAHHQLQSSDDLSWTVEAEPHPLGPAGEAITQQGEERHQGQ